jgi:hypothetical protein
MIKIDRSSRGVGPEVPIKVIEMEHELIIIFHILWYIRNGMSVMAMGDSSVRLSRSNGMRSERLTKCVK